MPCVYSEIRSSPLIQRAKDYALSVARFSIVGQELPVFIPGIQTGQSDVNRTIYNVGIRLAYSNIAYPSLYFTKTVWVNVAWSPEYTGEAPPPPPLLEMVIAEGSKYYWAQSYTHVCSLNSTTM